MLWEREGGEIIVVLIDLSDKLFRKVYLHYGSRQARHTCGNYVNGICHGTFIYHLGAVWDL